MTIKDLPTRLRLGEGHKHFLEIWCLGEMNNIELWHGCYKNDQLYPSEDMCHVTDSSFDELVDKLYEAVMLEKEKYNNN